MADGTFDYLVGASGVELGVEDGDLVVRTGGSESARVKADGTATGAWSPTGGSSSSSDIAPVFSRTGTLAVTAGAGRFPCPFAGTIIGVRAAVGTAPVGAKIICDVNRNGTTIFTTQANRPSIAEGGTGSSEATPDVASVAAGDLLSVDIDQIGSSTPGSDLSVVVLIQAA